MPGPDLDGRREREEALVERAIELARALLGLDREVGAGDVAHEERVAGEHRDRLAAGAEVAKQEGGVLGPVARGVHGLDLELAEAQPPAVVERLVRVLGVGEPVDVDRRPGGAGKPAVARDVIGVVVGFEHVLDSNPVQAGKVEVWLDVPLRVDDRGDPLADVADQVRRAAQVLVDHLPEQHRGPHLPILNPTFLTKIVDND